MQTDNQSAADRMELFRQKYGSLLEEISSSALEMGVNFLGIAESVGEDGTFTMAAGGIDGETASPKLNACVYMNRQEGAQEVAIIANIAISAIESARMEGEMQGAASAKAARKNGRVVMSSIPKGVRL